MKVNMYVMYHETLKHLEKLDEAIMHLQFCNCLAQSLINNWMDRNPKESLELLALPNHSLSKIY